MLRKGRDKRKKNNGSIGHQVGSLFENGSHGTGLIAKAIYALLMLGLLLTSLILLPLVLLGRRRSVPKSVTTEAAAVEHTADAPAEAVRSDKE